MSADNWAICPKCKKQADSKKEALVVAAASAYGRVSEADYRKRIAQASEAVELDETLREDFQIGVNKDGSFTIGYRCGCYTCGLEFVYSFNQQIPL